MMSVKALVMALSAGVFLLSASFIARADRWNKETTLMFNQKVEVPGMILEPGIYVFKLLDSRSNNDVVQIFNADESHLYKTLLTTPVYRPDSSENSVVTFEERSEGTPEAIKAWFCPGDNYGEEFIYPRTNQTEVAAPSKQNPSIRSSQPKSARSPTVLAEQC